MTVCESSGGCRPATDADAADGYTTGNANWAKEELIKKYQAIYSWEKASELTVGIVLATHEGPTKRIPTQVTGRVLTKLTTSEATDLAKYNGFRKISEKSHGQAVFYNGKTYITQDVDSHNGGIWKMGKTVKDLGSKDTRMGTYDALLNRIGD
jgi:hypothetical protein